MNILLLTSSFPSSEKDPIPGFVRDQVIALKKYNNYLNIEVIAPHTKATSDNYINKHTHYSEMRFHYFWPIYLEKVADGGIVPNINKNKILLFQIPFLIISQIIITYIRAKKIRADIIYAHWFMPQAISAAIVSHLTKIPFVFTTHSMDVIVLRKVPYFGKRIARWGIGKSKAITAVSNKTLEKIKYFYNENEWQKIRNKTHIIPMGINLSEFVETENNRASSEHLLFIGRLVEKKGLIYLLEAVKILKSNDTIVKLHVCGEGQELEKLKAYVKSNNLEDRVTFHGHVSGLKKKRIIEQCCISIIPSIDMPNDQEGLPVSVIESMAARKVVIATYDSGAGELIDLERSGLIVKSRDSQELASAITKAMKLINNGTDMGEKARLAVERLDWAKVAQDTASAILK